MTTLFLDRTQPTPRSTGRTGRCLSILAGALFLTGAAAAEPTSFTGTVVAVHSGDTLVVHDGQRQRPVRLLAIDAPSRDRLFGVRSLDRTTELALGRQVTVRAVREDPRGRSVATVKLSDGRDLGWTLVRDGLAHWDRRLAPDARGLEAAEAEARAAGRGLWSRTP